MTMFFSGLLFGFGIAILIDYLMDKHKADKERADFIQAEIDALRSAIIGDTEEDRED